MAKVLIVENSHIIALGLMNLIKTFPDVENIKLVSNENDCCKIVSDFEPNLILVNTSVLKHDVMQKIMELIKSDTVIMHIFNTSLSIDAPDTHLSIHDDKEVIQSKLEKAFERINKAQDDIETEELSPREKDILKEVALGLTNKEIAEKMYISTHTVISHRKNITRKLGIKTVSGLTVYAILNNIIQMDDIS